GRAISRSALFLTRQTILRQLSSADKRFCGCHDHVPLILIPRTCTPLHARSKKNEVAPEPAPASVECARYEHPPYGWSGNSHNPKPRRAAARGSGSRRSDKENA